MGVDAGEIDLGDGVAHLLGIERACGLDRLDEGLDVGNRGRGVIIGLVAVFLLVEPGEIGGVAEPGVGQMLRGQPRRHAEGIIRILAQRGAEIRRRHADREGIEVIRIGIEALRLADEIERLRLVAAPQDGIGLARLDQRQDRGEIAAVLAVGLVNDQLEPGRREQFARALGDRDVEAVIGRDQRHGLHLGIELGQHLDGAAVIVVGRRQRAEDVFIAAGEDLAGGAAALHHRHFVFLGHGTVVERVVAGERTQQEVHLVAGDELDVLAHAEIDVGLVVEQVERQLVALAVERDAALLVDRVDRELIGVAVIAPGIGEAAGELHRRPQGDRLGLRRRRAGEAEQQRSGGRQREKLLHRSLIRNRRALSPDLLVTAT